MRELGEATVRLLLNILRGNVKEAVSVTLPHALIVRASTAAPRAPHRRLTVAPRLSVSAVRRDARATGGT